MLFRLRGRPVRTYSPETRPVCFSSATQEWFSKCTFLGTGLPPSPARLTFWYKSTVSVKVFGNIQFNKYNIAGNSVCQPLIFLFFFVRENEIFRSLSCWYIFNSIEWTLRSYLLNRKFAIQNPAGKPQLDKYIFGREYFIWHDVRSFFCVILPHLQIRY